MLLLMPLIQLFVHRFDVDKIVPQRILLANLCVLALMGPSQLPLQLVCLLSHVFDLVAHVCQLRARLVEFNCKLGEYFICHGSIGNR